MKKDGKYYKMWDKENQHTKNLIKSLQLITHNAIEVHKNKSQKSWVALSLKSLNFITFDTICNLQCSLVSKFGN